MWMSEANDEEDLPMLHMCICVRPGLWFGGQSDESYLLSFNSLPIQSQIPFLALSLVRNNKN